MAPLPLSLSLSLMSRALSRPQMKSSVSGVGRNKEGRKGLGAFLMRCAFVQAANFPPPFSDVMLPPTFLPFSVDATRDATAQRRRRKHSSLLSITIICPADAAAASAAAAISLDKHPLRSVIDISRDFAEGQRRRQRRGQASRPKYSRVELLLPGFEIPPHKLHFPVENTFADVPGWRLKSPDRCNFDPFCMPDRRSVAPHENPSLPALAAHDTTRDGRRGPSP